MDICALIPALNQAATIKRIVERTARHIRTVVVIDDGSSDQTAKEAHAAGARVLNHTINKGKGAALQTGFHYAIDHAFDAVITLDGDGQHAPEDIPRLIAHAATADVVIGCRMRNSALMPKSIRMTNTLISWIISILIGQSVRDTQSGFRLIKTSLLKTIALRTTRYEIETELLIRAAHRGAVITEIPVQTLYYTTTLRPSIIRDSYDIIKELGGQALHALTARHND